MPNELTTHFSGLEFVNPFVLASAPPTESKRKILRAFEAGWGGGVTDTSGLPPVEGGAGRRTRVRRGRNEQLAQTRNGVCQRGLRRT